MAIANYRTGDHRPRDRQGRVVCTCFGVTEEEIERAIRENNLTTVEQVTNYTKAGGGCGQCHGGYRTDHREDPAGAERRRSRAEATKLTGMQKIKLIEETIERDIGPMLKRDGGDIELIDVVGDRVIVSFRGHVRQLPGLPVDDEGFVEAKLREIRVARYRRRGGRAMKTVYLDNNATTQGGAGSDRSHAPFLRGTVGQPVQHALFRRPGGGKVSVEAREQVAALIGAEPSEIVFTSCGTESDNTAICRPSR